MVEHVNYPVQGNTLLGLVSYSSTYYIGCELAQAWHPDTNTNAAAANTGFSIQHNYLVQKPNPNGSYQCTIPM